jgi:sugar phosphate isomerase/epimerase
MKPGFMLYSLSRSLRDGTLTVPQALALMKELGAEGVDLTQMHVADYTHAEVRAMVADAGLVPSCYIGGANLTQTDPAGRAEAVHTIRRVIDDAAEVGCPTALVTTGGCAEGQALAEGRRLVAQGLAEVLPHARAAGVVLTIEDFGSPRAPYQTGAEVLECCELAGPDLRITFDSGNMVMGDEDPVAALEIMRPRVVHAHAKDWERLPDDATEGLRSRAGRRYIGTVVGTGVLDYPTLFAALRAMNYQGFLSFEYEGRGDPIAAARQGMAYLVEGMRE